MNTVENKTSFCAEMTTLVQEGDTSIRILKDLQGFFDTRVRKLCIISIGFGTGGLERVLHEQTRSPVQIYECRPDQITRVHAFLSFLDKHDLSVFIQHPWLQAHTSTDASPTLFPLSTTIPASIDGTVTVKGMHNTLSCSHFPFTQMDILKLDMGHANEFLLYQILHTGFRPGLIFIRWDRHPDKYSDAMICAGHLQQVGYHLYGQEGSWFSYRFIDDCTYEYCSWARTDCTNPLLQAHEELVRTNLLVATGKPNLPK